MSDIREILDERGERYGTFMSRSVISQGLKRVMFTADRKLEDDQAEALEMIANKIARILNGDPDYADSWTDIAGYATLVAERLNGRATMTKEEIAELIDKMPQDMDVNDFIHELVNRALAVERKWVGRQIRKDCWLLRRPRG
jgi:hypothetical protein